MKISRKSWSEVLLVGDFGVGLYQNRCFGAEDWLDRAKLTRA